MRWAVRIAMAFAALAGCGGTDAGADAGTDAGGDDGALDAKDAPVPGDLPPEVPAGTLTGCPPGDVFAHEGEPCAGTFHCDRPAFRCCGQKFSDGYCGCNEQGTATDVFSCMHVGPPLECAHLCPFTSCTDATTCPEGWTCAPLPDAIQSRCLPPLDLCRRCATDADCGAGGACVDQGVFRACAAACPTGGCPEGFLCGAAEGTGGGVSACIPRGEGDTCPNTCEPIHGDCFGNQWGCDAGTAWEEIGAPVPWVPTADWGCEQAGPCARATYACVEGCRTDAQPWDIRTDFDPDEGKVVQENPLDLPVQVPADSPWRGCAEAAP